MTWPWSVNLIALPTWLTKSGPGAAESYRRTECRIDLARERESFFPGRSIIAATLSEDGNPSRSRFPQTLLSASIFKRCRDGSLMIASRCLRRNAWIFCKAFALRRVSASRALGEVGEADHCIHRRPDLVAHVGGKALLARLAASASSSGVGEFGGPPLDHLGQVAACSSSSARLRLRR